MIQKATLRKTLGKGTSERGWPEQRGYRPPVRLRQRSALALVVDAHEREVPVALRHVEAVSDDERRWDPEADVLQVELDLLHALPHEQRAHLEARRAAGLQVAAQV